jgi:hypothetical protein
MSNTVIVGVSKLKALAVNAIDDCMASDISLALDICVAISGVASCIVTSQ